MCIHFQADLLFMPAAKVRSKEFTMAMIAVESFSRYIWLILMPDRKSQSIIGALQLIFKQVRFTTAMLDKAGEHIAKATRQFFEEQGCHLYFTSSIKHAPQVNDLTFDPKNPFIVRQNER